MENNVVDDAERGDENIPYIDRLVREVEYNGGGAIVMGDEGDNGNLDDYSNWSDSDEENYDPSDDEMEWDSDEDSVKLIENYEPRKNAGALSEPSKSLLLWRLNKEESFSDWIIEVSVIDEAGESNKTLYHVHKAVLGAGPKKSGYFHAIFQSGQFSESSESKSAVELPVEVAADFPAFLDYIYSPPSECDCLIRSNNWRSLEYLANYFIIPGLVEAIDSFIKEDMHNVDRIKSYLSEFPAAEDDESKKIHSIAARVCIKMILHIDKDSSLLTTLTPAIALHVFSAVRLRAKPLSSDKQFHICRLAIEYIGRHLEELDANYFAAIAHNLYFPNDTTKAGLIAKGLLYKMKHAGWKDESATDMCTAVLFRYLTTNEQPSSKISKLSNNLPEKALALLFRELMTLWKSPRMKSINNISCKIMSAAFGKPVGSIVKISIKSCDFINYIRYLICRELNWIYDESVCVYFGERELANQGSVFDLGLTPNSELKVYYYTCFDDSDDGSDDDSDGGSDDDSDDDPN